MLCSISSRNDPSFLPILLVFFIILCGGVLGLGHMEISAFWDFILIGENMYLGLSV